MSEKKDLASEYLDGLQALRTRTVSVAKDVTTDKENYEVSMTDAPVYAEHERQRRAHTFNLPANLSEYLKREMKNGIVLGNPLTGVVDAVLSDEDELMGQEIIRLQVVQTPVFAGFSVLSTDSMILDLGSFVELVERAVAFMPDEAVAKSLLAGARQVRVSETVEMNTAVDGVGVNGLLSTIKVQGMESQKTPFELPTQFRIKLKPWIGISAEVDFTVRLTITVRGSSRDVMVRLWSDDLFEKITELWAVFVMGCIDLPDGSLAGMGEIRFGAWEYRETERRGGE